MNNSSSKKSDYEFLYYLIPAFIILFILLLAGNDILEALGDLVFDDTNEESSESENEESSFKEEVAKKVKEDIKKHKKEVSDEKTS